jgi:hypothetical protein
MSAMRNRPMTCRKALANLLRALHFQHANSNTVVIHEQVRLSMLDGYKALGSGQKEVRAPKGKK